MPRLLILVPAFNEELGIAATLERLKQVVTPLHADILVVDDGSTDRTAELAAATGVRVLRHDTNRGYGASLKTGLRNTDADWICITDADGTYPCERIPDLVAHMHRYDMVVGARTGTNVAIPLIRRPAKAFLNLLANVLTGQKIPDLNSGLRVFKRSCSERYMHLFPSGFSFTTTLTMAMLNDDFLVKFVPIDYFARAGQSKIRALRDTYGFFMLILRMTVIFKPLKIFLPVTALLLTCTAFVATLDVARGIAGLSDKTVILSLASLFVFLAGLLADAIASRGRS
ncbi:MAG: glycosyltransferase family 2 protein [Planctomycetes bacterium]|nr:glycosyltransferase family 2 protein [Planctomycetota bacterium]MCC7169784.1 glycosyltransferase family 2 protein [Planctomycetota bacterium]